MSTTDPTPTPLTTKKTRNHLQDSDLAMNDRRLLPAFLLLAAFAVVAAPGCKSTDITSQNAPLDAGSPSTDPGNEGADPGRQESDPGEPEPEPENPSPPTADDPTGVPGELYLIPPPPLVVPVKEFLCVPDAVAGTVDVADVAGIPGATVAIEPNGLCTFDLVFRRGPGERAVLSSSDSPGGYLLAVGGVSPSGRAVVCASNIRHGMSEDASRGAAGRVHSTIDSVSLECAVEGDEGFGPLTTVVEPDGDWAAWAMGLEEANDGSGAFRVLWMRDFSFQFLNLNNRGRPETDGIYATTFETDEEGAPVALTVEKLMDGVMGEDAVVGEAWEPTPAELEEMGEFIKVDEGACPPPMGCPIE